MKKISQRKNIFIVFLLLQISFCNSQISVPFSVRYQSYVKGDMTIIANNITDKVEKKKSSKTSIESNDTKHNDEYQMGYIDIDKDESTFSSSSAELILEKNSNKKIVYAGLYWSATYKYTSGHKIKNEKFVVDVPTREAFDKIKIKLPNQDSYTDIQGKVLFDGINDKKFKESAPYAVYADITNEIKKASNPFGVYTVANVKATQGTISGGVAGGWSIIFIYEDLSMKGKFITTYDGFAGVSDRSTDIQFTGFETLPEGNVKAQIALTALEGDKNLVGDQLQFKTPQIKKYITLDNLLRSSDNFFNSSITIGNDYFLSREPNNKNTLGFDSCLISIPNQDNSIIGNNTKEATLRIRSSGDRCFIFFTAFDVEVTEPEIIKPIETKAAEVIATVIDTPKPVETTIPVVSDVKDVIKTEEVKEVVAISSDIKPATIITETKEILSSPKLVVVDTKKTETPPTEKVIMPKETTPDFTTTPLVTENKTVIETKEVLTQKEIVNYNIDGLKKGYYIVANVFAKEYNRKNFLGFLKKAGQKAASFFNPTKKYHYVYLENSDNKEEIQKLYDSKINNSYKKDIWILSVNNNQNEVIANNTKPQEVIKKEAVATTTLEKQPEMTAKEAIASIEKESELIAMTNSTNNNVSINKNGERIDAISDKNLVENYTKVAINNPSLTTLPSLEVTSTEITPNPTEPISNTTTVNKDLNLETKNSDIINPSTINKEIQNVNEAIAEKPVIQKQNDVTTGITISPTIVNKDSNISKNNPQKPKVTTVKNKAIAAVSKTTPKKESLNTISKTTIHNNPQINNYNLAGLSKGYYIVANVFAKQRNCKNFILYLKNKGLNASSFYNSDKKYYYVYIEKSENKDEIQNLYNSKINNSYKDDIWVLSVNNSAKQESIVDSQ